MHAPLAASRILWACTALVAVTLSTELRAQTDVSAPSTSPSSASYDEAPQAPLDPIERLQARIDSGAVTLAFDSITGWLPSVLGALAVPVESQGLVFSRTSLQTDRVAPWAPRAVYFNDDVYIGYVRDGGVMEVAAVRPDGGTEFYTLAQQHTERPRFQRETTTCLMCHEARSMTGGIPGLIVRSVLTDRLGYPIGEVTEGQATERTPFERRWGGWYVSGEAASMGHSANVFSPDLRHEVSDVQRYVADFDFARGRTDDPAGERFEPSAYLSPHSDLVALTVLLHQSRVHNLISLAHEAADEALRLVSLQAGDPGGPVEYESLSPYLRGRIEGAVAALVDAMLFVGEVAPPAPLRGPTAFAADFQRRGPWDSQGRSLRELDLERRTFRYPLSFLIYSEAFDGLPALVKNPVYQRLRAVLEAADGGEAYAHLDADDRRAILEILVETKPDFGG
ncbi:MAG: hypothetical protein KJP18_05080 [Gemmatimonadetes bacterium]|nr:hypothetical protein [Gemmatimonadota bacterium]NNK64074.1 hypothetical protein [Gemmatimonadota bacterium]